jgi:SAM-dependent methyltransferase
MAIDTREHLRERVPPPTAAEREVADLLPVDAGEHADAVLARVPFWFHTFSLNGGEVYTPGVARDHRYRIPFFAGDLSGARVLDVGTFDGFYAFLAEARGAERVVAVDNEQYRDWVEARWGIELEGGEAFRTIAELLGSTIEYQRLDAFDLDALKDRFDYVLCFGILHRVANPLGLLEVIRRRVDDGGSVLLETYGVEGPGLEGAAAIHVCEPGEVYARDDYVYWGFTGESLTRLGRHAGFTEARILSQPVIAGHPRVICELTV